MPRSRCHRASFRRMWACAKTARFAHGKLFLLKDDQQCRTAFSRRLKSRIGTAAATATAHKLARLYWTLLQFGQENVDAGAKVYEERYRERVVTSLRKRAKALGYELAPLAAVA